LKCLTDRASLSDLQEALPFLQRQIACERDLSLEDIPDIPARALDVPKPHLDTGERNIFSFGVHANCHCRAAPKAGQELARRDPAPYLDRRDSEVHLRQAHDDPM
jgi:hypothetical protein